MKRKSAMQNKSNFYLDSLPAQEHDLSKQMSENKVLVKVNNVIREIYFRVARAYRLGKIHQNSSVIKSLDISNSDRSSSEEVSFYAAKSCQPVWQRGDGGATCSSSHHIEWLRVREPSTT